MAQVVPPYPIELDLLDERSFELGDALTHPHRPPGSLALGAGHNAGLTARTRPIGPVVDGGRAAPSTAAGPPGGRSEES